MKTNLTVTEYARLKGISRTAVQKQIDAEKIETAEKVGSTWIIKDLDLSEAERKKAFMKPKKGGKKKNG